MFQAYTEFFTHTGHICYFLQNAIWQERTEGVINALSHTSSLAVSKLERSLQHHEVIEKKQNQVLGMFQTMEELAHRQRDLIWEVYSSLKGSIDGVRYLMSLFLVELVGIETFILALCCWVVIQLLPRFGYSRCWLNLVLVGEQVVEVVLRRAYMKVVETGGKEHSQPTADDMVSHSISVSAWCRMGGGGSGDSSSPPHYKRVGTMLLCVAVTGRIQIQQLNNSMTFDCND